MSGKGNGGSAFPISTEFGPKIDSNEGMSLRDYFAAKAMQGAMRNATWSDLTDCSDELARMAYHVADNMIEARKR